MVVTRRASMLERQRSESVCPSSETPTSDVKPDLAILDRASPSLVRSTPQLETQDAVLAVDDDEDEVVQAMSVITIKEETTDLDELSAQIPKSTPTPLKLEPDSEATPDLTTSASTTLTIEVTSPPPTLVKDEPDNLGSEDEDDEEARDTVGALRSIKALPGRARRESSAGSVVSIEDAKASIDDFMADREAFTADEENKLRFWQSLCIEFRLVKIEGDLLPSFDQLTLGTHSISPAQTWSNNPNLPPIPTSCAEAKKLLKAKAHVNLVDYLAAREVPAIAGEDKDYTHLLWPSRLAVVEYTRKHKKFLDKDLAKEDLLQPLLKTMRRGARS